MQSSIAVVVVGDFRGKCSKVTHFKQMYWYGCSLSCIANNSI